MRALSSVVLLLVCAFFAVGQTYTIQTFAGGALPVSVPGTSASLYPPHSVAVDNSGNLYFTSGNAILRLDAKTGILTLVAGSAAPGYSGDNGPATSAQLDDPAGVALDAAGNLYIADR